MHVCFDSLCSMQEVVALVRHHQYVTQAVDDTLKYKSYAVNAVSGEDDRITHMEKMVERRTSRMQTFSKQNRPGSGIVYYKCGEEGHFRKDCQSRRDDKAKKGEKSGKCKSPLISEEQMTSA